MSRGRRFAPVITRVTEILYGPEPVGAAGAAVLERYTDGQLNGGPLGGTPHYGMKGDPSMSFTGYVSDPQAFVGAAQMGASKNLSVQDYPALPSATAPESLPVFMSDWDSIEGLVDE